MEESVAGFSAMDFIVFFGMLGLTSLIGVYYAIKDRNTKNKTTDNYNYGGRSMSPIPLGVSIAVTHMSAITMIGFPTEAYIYGAVVSWYAVAPFLATTVACLYYIPLLHKLKLQTTYEFFEVRFDIRMRKFESTLSIVKMIFYMGVTIYLPSLALNAVTPLSLNWSIIITSGICTFYTSLGGMKAVVWTDTLQSIIMLVGALAALIKTVTLVGGFENVWNALEKGGRLNFWDMNPDPTLQRTFWTVSIGLTFRRIFTSCCLQASGQRYLSCKSVKDARTASIVSILPVTIITFMSVLNGCAAYAYFQNCDPLKAGKITKPDQLIAYLVADVFQDAPGMAGLFVSAALSGTLSTVSSGINALGSLILEDFIIPTRPNLSETKKVTIGKVTGVLLGCCVTAVAFVTKLMGGTVVSILLSISGATDGPLLALFTLGIFFPWTNTIGALTGQIIASVFMSWIAVSSAIYGKPPEKLRALPTSIEGCSIDAEMFNNTTPFVLLNMSNTEVGHQDIWRDLSAGVTSSPVVEKPALYYSLWSLSFLYMNVIGFILTITIGLLTSFATGANKPSKSNPRYFLPFLDNQHLPQRIRTFFRFGVPEEDNLRNKITTNETRLPFLDKEDKSEKHKILQGIKITGEAKL